jgi:hypothetical protein
MAIAELMVRQQNYAFDPRRARHSMNTWRCA